MEKGIYHIEFYRDAIQLGRAEPFDGYLLSAQHHAERKGRSTNADFVRVLDDGLENWSLRLDA